MKPSFKTTTLIAAIGLGIYTCYLVVLHVVRAYSVSPDQFDIVRDICLRVGMDCVLIAILIAGIALIQHRPLSHVSKLFRIYTIVMASLMLVVVIGYSICSPGIYISGVLYFYPAFVLRVVFLLLGIIWLVMLSRQEATERTSSSFRIVICCGIIALCVPMLLEIISGISLLSSGKLLFLHSSCIRSWVRYFVPTIVLCWYSLDLYRQEKNR